MGRSNNNQPSNAAARRQVRHCWMRLVGWCGPAEPPTTSINQQKWWLIELLVSSAPASSFTKTSQNEGLVLCDCCRWPKEMNEIKENLFSLIGFFSLALSWSCLSAGPLPAGCSIKIENFESRSGGLWAEPWQQSNSTNSSVIWKSWFSMEEATAVFLFWRRSKANAAKKIWSWMGRSLKRLF